MGDMEELNLPIRNAINRELMTHLLNNYYDFHKPFIILNHIYIVIAIITYFYALFNDNKTIQQTYLFAYILLFVSLMIKNLIYMYKINKKIKSEIFTYDKKYKYLSLFNLMIEIGTMALIIFTFNVIDQFNNAEILYYLVLIIKLLLNYLKKIIIFVLSLCLIPQDPLSTEILNNIYHISPPTIFIFGNHTPMLHIEAVPWTSAIEPKCSICLDDFKENESISKLQCNHYFHDHCINNAVMYRLQCPNCRAAILPIV
ncbi:MAG: putative E3 ubiquitin-protein ligase RNF115 isoform X1 [Edafosvirus sp.]|uniref:Putative E3 ubiquitin-protein ligase RNF115 isoform X1 n=1 Tax=Edafosvirus sp. TaxID=2487765 RepID=A0A3G4ZZC0_9VIRU|nr:MAG: putative E3 ubiquitin-protein ligase RNF115 isoform X1 [Edafosvirus sp.]